MRCRKHQGLGFSYCNLCEVEQLREEVDSLREGLAWALPIVDRWGSYLCEDFDKYSVLLNEGSHHERR